MFNQDLFDRLYSTDQIFTKNVHTPQQWKTTTSWHATLLVFWDGMVIQQPERLNNQVWEVTHSLRIECAWSGPKKRAKTKSKRWRKIPCWIFFLTGGRGTSWPEIFWYWIPQCSSLEETASYPIGISRYWLLVDILTILGWKLGKLICSFKSVFTTVCYIFTDLIFSSGAWTKPKTANQTIWLFHIIITT